MSGIELVSVTKSYGQVAAVHEVSFAVEAGEFVSLVGPSGCGKSTILRMIAGLESITGGDILFDGKKVNPKSPKERNVAMVFQNYALYPHMTVRQNIGLNLKIAGVDRKQIVQRVADAALLLGISPYLDRRPAELSGGQRQRVAMGRAIVRNPAVFLFDEPLSNLDAQLRVQMRGEIKSLHNKIKSTIIYVTHDQIEATTLSDRVIVLNRGRIEQIGYPIELYRHPANEFVAGFIGSPPMNFLPATIIARNSGAFARFGDGQEFALPSTASTEAGRAVKVGFRPEKIRPTDDLSGMATQVCNVERTGAQVFLHAISNGQPLTVVLPETANCRIGDVVRLTVAPGDIHLFDGDTGVNLLADPS